MRKIYETAIILIGTLSWWGFVYPELCLTEDAYEQEAGADAEGVPCGRQMTRKEEKAAPGEQQSEEGSFWETGFQVGELCIKSRAAEYVYQVSEKK